jgi:flagellar hook-associated protein 2
LFGDITLKSIKSNLQNTVLNGGLSEFGVTFGSDGKLALDTDDLQTALDADDDATKTAYTSMAQSLNTVLENLTDSVDGTVTVQQASIRNSIDWLKEKITKTEDSIDQKMATLKTQFINMDAALNQLQTQSSWLSSVFPSS